ncbi:toll/interleukin-1 receptor domain-containing protein [Methylovulum psychrotolerans]|uniref:TIR domain-containing protein n=1 Tax=Methylovulum psychrotolerans TaxID=1704499 RepID=A0A1Z4BY56_9GAMM|nr:toll/interleukin-1 receptor domain-containing protein [Methylovulum psychrotolerans]ASF46226.1 hypothetical protein CEK71_09095 [Methylovulum psychrotolerans]
MNISTDQSPLFNRAQLWEELNAQSKTIATRVQAISEPILRAKPDSELVEELVEELKMIPLELDEGNKQMTKEEIDIDVTDNPYRNIFRTREKILIPGIKVVISVPFTGNPQLWHLQPNTFTFSPPRGQIDSLSGLLYIAFKQPADEPIEQIKAALESRLAEIRSYISHQKKDLAGNIPKLRREISEEITGRRSRLTKHDSISDLLGIPEVKTAINIEVVNQPFKQETAANIPTKSNHQAPAESWDVFVSHASEDKEAFVRPLADALNAVGLSVWFDEFTLTLGDSLRRSIDKGLARSRYGIVVVSKAFLEKEWPQRELDGLVAREEDGLKVLLPIWHEITAAEIRQKSPTLADRLAVSSSKGISKVVDELLKVVRPI